MSSSVTTYLHLGAHRTGTSSLQLTIDHNREALEAAGYDLAYPGRDGAPHGRLQLRLPTTKPGQTWDRTEAAIAEIKRHLTGREKFLLSEENVPGQMYNFLQSRFYPVRRGRLDTLNKALPGPVAHLLFVLRPYDEIFASAYRLRAAHFPMLPFYQLRRKYMRMTEGWADLVQDLRDALRPEGITVVDYRVRGSNTKLLSYLLPDFEASALGDPQERVNQSLSDTDLLARQRELHTNSGSDVEFPQDVPFAAFRDKQLTVLRARYKTALDQIDAMENVRLVRASD